VWWAEVAETTWQAVVVWYVMSDGAVVAMIAVVAAGAVLKAVVGIAVAGAVVTEAEAVWWTAVVEAVVVLAVALMGTAAEGVVARRDVVVVAVGELLRLDLLAMLWSEWESELQSGGLGCSVVLELAPT